MAGQARVNAGGTKRWFETAAAQVQSRAAQRALALHGWRLINAAVEDFIENNDLLRAAALTYTVALSIVPILALGFSALKGLGAADQMRPLINKYLALGSSGTADQLMSYVQNVNAAALGTAGAAFLVFTVVSTLGNIEQAFNAIFRVSRSRSYLRKFSDYLSVLFTVPLMIAAALAVTAVVSVRVSALPILTTLAPYLFVWGAFFFLYTFFPYTKVKPGPALLGSFVAAILFQLAQWGYVRFQVGAANYKAIYGALATVPIFLVWTYMAWAIILFGAEVTAAAQRGVDYAPMHPESPDFPCAAALHVLVRLADQQTREGPALHATDLAHQLGLSPAILEPIVEGLKSGGFIVEAGAEKGAKAGAGLYLVRAPGSIKLADALRAVIADNNAANADSRVASVMRQIASAQMGVLATMTLADLLRAATAPSAAQTTARSELTQKA
ncbi:MAG TPA: YhjD/YihY/BrkB family envelope integrity protein [Candidatus Binataceae bacterium]|nr:YhjD/YihY/BrkB family envelope integrity protein [Candidatus Binataceae bacterium]